MNKEENNYQYQTPKNPILYLLPFILCLLTLLTGCVDYDVGVSFDSPYDGTIVQHVRVGEDLTSLDRSATKEWLKSIEDRTYKLRGKVKRLSSDELAVVIPFSNAKELAEKFNQFFYGNSSPTDSSLPTETDELTSINSRISLRQSNLLLLERNYINLIIDLRALGDIPEQNQIVFDSSSFVNLTFQLNAPWITRSLKGRELLSPVKNTPGKLIWQLQPGKINHIKAVVWLPNYLGIGTAIIIVLIIVGFYVKYRHFPGVTPAKTQSV